MIYNTSLVVDSNDKLITCPVCQNTEFDPAGFYCKICGKPRANFCADESSHENCGRLNKANSRYCEYCGSKTVFFNAGLLTPWEDVPDEEKSEEQPAETNTSGFSAVETDELPF